MKKNENGFPFAEKGSEPCFNAPRTPVEENESGNSNAARAKEGCSRGNDAGTDPRRMITDSECDQAPLAYVYAPMQKFCMLYSAEDALKHGTLFENLYKPMEVYGRE